MEGIKTMVFLTLSFVRFSIQCTCDSTEILYELYNKKFLYHSPYVQPFGNRNRSALTVSIDLHLGSIIELNEEGILTINIWSHIKWCHLSVAWNTNPKLSQINNFIIHKSLIWHPNIILRNSANSATRLGNNLFLIKVWSNGTVSWIPSQILKVSCLLNEKLYPFDTQICDINFTANQPTNKLKLISSHDFVGLDRFDSSAIWDVANTSVKNFTHPLYSYSGINFRFFLRRRHKYYVFYMIIPLLTLSSVTVLVFQFPVESGLGIYVSVSFLLSFSVFRKFIMENMPKSSRYVPNLSILLCWNLFLCALSLCGILYISNTLKKSQPGQYSKWLEYCLIFLQNQKSNRIRETPISNFNSQGRRSKNQKCHLQVEEKPVTLKDIISLDKESKSNDWEMQSFLANSLPSLQEISILKNRNFQKDENKKKKIGERTLSLPNLYSMLLKIPSNQVLALKQITKLESRKNYDHSRFDNKDIERNESGNSGRNDYLSQDRDYETINDETIPNAIWNGTKRHQIIEIRMEILKEQNSNQQLKSLKKTECFNYRQNENKECAQIQKTPDSVKDFMLDSAYISTDETFENKAQVSFFEIKQEKKKIWEEIKIKSPFPNGCDFQGQETASFQNTCFWNFHLEGLGTSANDTRRRSWEEIKRKRFEQNLSVNKLIEKSASLPNIHSILLTNQENKNNRTFELIKLNSRLTQHQNSESLLPLKTAKYFTNIQNLNKTANDWEYNFQGSDKSTEEADSTKSYLSTDQFHFSSFAMQDLSLPIESPIRDCPSEHVAVNLEQSHSFQNGNQNDSFDCNSENSYLSLDHKNGFILDSENNSKYIQMSKVLNTFFFWVFLFINIVSMIIIFSFWIT